MTFEPGRLLSHYRLVEKIGQGGMGIVWKAEDTILGRPVAIKILPPHAAGDEKSRQRFLEEARLASSLNDAHVVQVHELGRDGDVDFIVMELVEGQPLSRMIRDRRLTATEVAALGMQAARALARAHHGGLLHRDIKPGNILVTPEGDVKVVDFGLASLFRPRDHRTGSEDPTLVGADTGADPPSSVFGTPAYMSPEQTRGEPPDPRSDIFSLGIVLYQMTTGRAPFSADSVAELLAQVARARPASPREFAPDMPLELERIIVKALARKPSNRYQTADDLAVDLARLARDLDSGTAVSFHDLKAPAAPPPVPPPARSRRARVLALSLAAAALLAAGVWVFGRSAAGGASDRTVLVLPLEVHGQKDGADYVGRAFAEALAVNLAVAGELVILPVPSAAPDVGSDPLAPSRTALRAGAGRALTGSLIREEGRLRATLSLLDTNAGRIIWGIHKEAEDGALADLAAALARELAVRMGASPSRRYEYFRYGAQSPALASSPVLSEVIGAIRRYEYSFALDSTEKLVLAFPDEPEALVLRCIALAMASEESPAGSPVRTSVETCVSALQRLDPGNPWHDVIRGTLLLRDGAAGEAVERLSAVLAREDLTPAARAYVLGQRSMSRSKGGDFTGATADAEEAVRLDPANDFVLATSGSILAQQGKLEEALVRARQALALNPTAGPRSANVAEILYQLGRYEESLEPFASSCDVDRNQATCAFHAIALRMAARAPEAREAAERAARLAESANGAFNLACYHALAGDRAEALRLLRRSVELAPADPAEIQADETLASLRADPEFRRIVAEAARTWRRE